MRIHRYLVGLLAALFASAAMADVTLNEGFEDVSSLTTRGWVLTNNSTPGGSIGWFQGIPGNFAAAAGPENSYVAANPNNAPFGGAVSNWLLTPVLDFSNGGTFSFALHLLGEGFIDTVQLYLSLNGSSSDVGSTTTSTGVFDFLGSFSSDSDTGWITHAYLFGPAGGAVSGRLGFRYLVGNTAMNGDYVGIDSVSFTTPNVAPVPEPETWALLAAGLAGIGWMRRRRVARR